MNLWTMNDGLGSGLYCDQTGLFHQQFSLAVILGFLFTYLIGTGIRLPGILKLGLVIVQNVLNALAWSWAARQW